MAANNIPTKKQIDEYFQVKLRQNIQRCKREIERRREICLAMMKQQEKEDRELKEVQHKFRHTHLDDPKYQTLKKQKKRLEKDRDTYEKTVFGIYIEQQAYEREILCYQSELSQIVNF